MTDDNTSNTSSLKELVFDLALRGAIAGQLQSQDALPFLKSIVRECYDISPDGEILANDKTPLGLDNRPLAIEQIGEHLRSKHGYLFQPESAQPSGIQAPAPKPAQQKSRSEMSVAEKADFIRIHGQDAFFDLPADPIAAIPLNEKSRSQMTMEERAAVIREKGSEFYLSLPE